MKFPIIAPRKTRECIFRGGTAHIRSDRGKSKIFSMLCLVMILSVLSAGCSANQADPEQDQPQTGDSVQTAIEQQLEDTPLPKGYEALHGDGDFLTVFCSDGEVTVTVMARMPYTIPYVAEFFLPAARTAAEEAGVTLTCFDVSSYNPTDCIVEGTFATWTCTDGETGNLETDVGGYTTKEGMTIEELYDYYADRKRSVQMMVEEAGGTLE